MFECDGSNTLSSEHAEESVQKNRRQLQEQIQIKSDSLSIIFQMMYKLEYLSNKCACPDLAKDSIDQVSFLHHDAALIFDESCKRLPARANAFIFPRLSPLPA